MRSRTVWIRSSLPFAQGYLLGRSLDLFDEAIELGSRAVDMVDKFELTPREADKLEQEYDEDAANESQDS